MRIILSMSVIALLLSGCVAPSTLLVNEQGQGYRCAAAGFGFIGAPLAEHTEGNCVKDYEQLGYVELPHVYLGIKLDFTKVPPPIITVNQGSPAEKVGLLVGDLILQADDKPLDGGDGNFVGFYRLLNEKRAGDSISITVNRKGQRLTMKALLVDRGEGEADAEPPPAPALKPGERRIQVIN